jgi:ABC-type transporter Mla MlaB component
MTTDDGTPPDREVPNPARRPPERSSIALVLCGPIVRAQISDLCEGVRATLECAGWGPVDCDVGALETDAVTVEALARVQLTARRLGRRVRFMDATPELRGLLDLMGLDEALPCGGASGLEPCGEAEEREQARGVEEERDPGDPPV